MKVLYIFVRGWGQADAVYGTERRFIEIVRAYEKAGVMIHSIERFPSQRKEHPELASLLRFEVSVRVMPLRSLAFGLGAYFAGLAGIRKFGMPDAIVCGESNLTNLLPGYLLSVSLRRRFAVVLHHAHKEPSQVTNTIRAILLHEAQLLLSISEATMKSYRRAYHLGKEKSIVVGNGIETPQDVPTTGQRRYDGLYVGRFYESKGIDLLPRIWRRVVDRLPDAQLVAAGGYGSRAEEYSRLVEEVGLGRNLEVRGYLADASLQRLFRDSKIFILPSQQEGFSLATAQAMAHGCVCVVSDLPALRSVFADNAIYEPRSPEAFADDIISLLQDRGKLDMLSRRGREFAKQFSWSSVAKKELDGLESLTKKSQSSRV